MASWGSKLPAKVTGASIAQPGSAWGDGRPAPAQASGALAPSREVQELWFATLRTKWQTLVLVPASAGGTALPLARQLVEVGAMHRGRAPRLVVAEGLGLAEIAQITFEMGSGESSGWSSSGDPSQQTNFDPQEPPRMIIALDPIVTNPLATAIALAADAVALVVEYGQTDMDSARHTLQQIGPERFIGCVIVGEKK